ncbi:serine hydrolase domain-containing protein [Chondromyces apiculatus]|uniref:Beta-lactamase class C and other penicillin binding protein n=1 Tax=Chondromyces apiculatus DSM 436 TaxID=1192034 RepID=A0A017THP6_9BACT|nr:serine hydrolase domain-containing protein [Chondromyces apiculatus]EYF08422.1 Beta-lactamase class C and other penicillin binding protein [Chondromyces apiculatus DSM 436]
MSNGRLSKARLDRMHEVMAGHVARGYVPGAVTLICRRGEVHVETFGTKALGGSDLVERDTIFRIASMTKPITAAATMILVEECKLRLDEPVDRLLPELADRRVLKRLDGPLDETVPAQRPITVRDLLTCRMGLGMILEVGPDAPIQKAMRERQVEVSAFPSQLPGPDAWIGALGSLPLAHQPGEGWLYHTSSEVLGVLIARASGKPFDAFLRERLFEPLGMKDTGFTVPEEKLPRLARVYESPPDGGPLVPVEEPGRASWSEAPSFLSGGGGLASTADDTLAFAAMLLNQGKHGRERILSRPSVEVMTSDHLTPAQKAISGFFPGYWDSRGWGFGVCIGTRRDELAGNVGRYGWDGGYGTSWWSDPREEMVGILMTQRMVFPLISEIYLDFWTSVYQAIDD